MKNIHFSLPNYLRLVIFRHVVYLFFSRMYHIFLKCWHIDFYLGCTKSYERCNLFLPTSVGDNQHTWLHNEKWMIDIKWGLLAMCWEWEMEFYYEIHVLILDQDIHMYLEDVTKFVFILFKLKIEIFN